MKIKLKTYFSTLTFLLLATFLWQCEKDIVDQQNQLDKTNFEVNAVKMSDISGMSNHLSKTLNRNMTSKNSDNNQAIFDVDNVMEVIDTLQNTNYSINFIFPETAEGTFYNLVVGKDSLGILKTPYVLRYTSNPTSYQAFADSGFNMDYFNGIISMHKYTDYFELDEFSKTSDPYCPPDYDENGDPIPCEESNVNGGGTGSGGTGTGNGGSNNSGGSSGPYNGSGGGSGGSSSSCPFSILVHREERPCSACPSGTGWFTVVTYLYDCGGVKSAGASKTSDDCPECNVNDGGVGVNVPRLVTLLISQLSITDQDVIDWMEAPDNLDQVELVNQWLRENGSTPENEAFVNLALEALENDNELDFEELEEMYNDMDKECQALFFLNHIIKSDKTLPQFLKDNFLGNDTYNIQFSDININPIVDANANTRLPDNLVFNENTAIVIEFDNDYLDAATNLSIIQATAHELVHAYLVYLYIENELLSFNPSYTELKSAFDNYESNPNNANGVALGEAMHDVYDDFLDIIVDSVFDYATVNNISGATLEYCQKLVIGSHQYTQAFQDLTSEQQTEYSTISVNEQNGNTNAKGSKCD